LDHFNGLHIRSFSDAVFTSRVIPYFENAGLPVDQKILVKIAPILKERIATLDDVVDMAGFFFRDDVNVDVNDLIGKNLTADQTRTILKDSYGILAEISNMLPELTEPPMRGYVEKSGFSAGQVFGVFRVAVTGQKVSPPLFESMEIIGREKVLQRIKVAIELLN
jgi:glutamyl-tRNA synthetase